jgi:hypothetical protein
LIPTEPNDVLSQEPSTPYKGVLCTPFPQSSRPAGENDDLKKLITWIKEAAKDANIILESIEGQYDSDQQIIERIYHQLEAADLVVTVVREANASAFFEAGYAIGLRKPLLYVVREGEEVPFDARGVEYFLFREIDPTAKTELAEAMSRCLDVTATRARLTQSLTQLRQHGASLTLRENLYSACIAHALAGLTDWVCSWQQNGFEVRSQNLLDVGTFILSAISEGGFATEYYSGHASWRQDTNDVRQMDYFVATRTAVRRGRKIVRVYVVDDESQVNEEQFRSKAWADSAAGIDTRYILTSALPDPGAKDFGLWDDELLCEVEYIYSPGQPPRLYRCRYWDDEYHVSAARAWRRSLERNAKPCPDLPSETNLLNESVLALKDECAIYCAEQTDGKVDCSAYHLHWQELRQRGLVSTPGWHAEFYTQAFRSWSTWAQKSERDSFRILISGLADYAMLYWVAQSISRQVRDRCTFHILDICQSPLMSCQWLERRLKAQDPPLELRVEYRKENILAATLPDAHYDLIASDAFLTRFETIELKEAVVNQWVGALADGGRIVTTARVQEGSTDLDAAARLAFVQRVLEGYGSADVGPLAPEIARAYADYILSAPFVTEAELRRFLERTRKHTVVNKLTFKLLSEREMVKANYARLVLQG